MTLASIIETVKSNLAANDAHTTTTIYTNYDSQYPTKKLISNQGYSVGDLYTKSGSSLLSFIVCMLLVNLLLEFTK
ncbi:hypothetical protein BD408DRAFT_417605 [Parasitella parasitica]|nr:hypothetical protein BD408DRAFT_417605 [Parasitella parasitica]